MTRAVDHLDPSSRAAGESIYSDGHYLELNPSWHVSDSAWKAANVLRMLERSGLRPRRMGEIGCGAGEILVQLRNRMTEEVCFEGWDISPDAYQMARSRESERLRFIHGDLLTSDTEPYDVVLCMDVFEHVEDYMGFLRSLRPRGAHHLFHIPLNLSVQTVLRGGPILRARARLGHIHYFTMETALATLRDTGFRVKDWFYTGGSLELPGKRLHTRVAKLPRRLLFGLHPDLTVRILGGYSLMVLAD